MFQNIEYPLLANSTTQLNYNKIYIHFLQTIGFLGRCWSCSY